MVLLPLHVLQAVSICIRWQQVVHVSSSQQKILLRLDRHWLSLQRFILSMCTAPTKRLQAILHTDFINYWLYTDKLGSPTYVCREVHKERVQGKKRKNRRADRT